MDIHKIRLQNLTFILATEFNGVRAELARKMGIAANNISRYYSKNPKDRRNISDEAARQIEKAAGVATFWMDHLHEQDEDGFIKNDSETQKKQDAGKYQALLQLATVIEDFTPAELSELFEQLAIIRRRKSGGF